MSNATSHVRWVDICRPKEEGALGLRRVKDIFNAYAMKKIWLLINKPQDIWSDWMKKRYLKEKSFWQIDRVANYSQIWKNMLMLRESIRPILSISLGNGKMTRLWWDPWDENSSSASQGFVVNQLQDNLGNPFIVDFWQNNDWVFPYSENEEASTIFSKLAEIHLCEGEEDVYSWNLTPSLNYSLKSAWDVVRSRGESKPWAKLIWNEVVAPSRAWYCWRAMHNRLPTIDRLHKLEMQIVNSCCLCNRNLENINHLFFCYVFSSAILSKCSKTLGWNIIEGQSLASLLDRLADGFRNCVENFAACILISEAVFFIWEERNRRIHNEGEMDWLQIWRKIKAQTAQQMIAKLKMGSESRVTNPKLIKLAQIGQKLCFFEPP